MKELQGNKKNTVDRFGIAHHQGDITDKIGMELMVLVYIRVGKL